MANITSNMLKIDLEIFAKANVDFEKYLDKKINEVTIAHRYSYSGHFVPFEQFKDCIKEVKGSKYSNIAFKFSSIFRDFLHLISLDQNSYHYKEENKRIRLKLRNAIKNFKLSLKQVKKEL